VCLFLSRWLHSCQFVGGGRTAIQSVCGLGVLNHGALFGQPSVAGSLIGPRCVLKVISWLPRRLAVVLVPVWPARKCV
jgi:hypothetical protein